MPRFFVDMRLQPGARTALPVEAARHARVLRLQPGDGVVLFNGEGAEWMAEVCSMDKADVVVTVGDARAAFTECAANLTLALGVPANDRMDTLVEKATELGVAGVLPLMCERSVLRLDGERAVRRVSHWQGVAVAAAEQSGRVKVPVIAPVQRLSDWLSAWTGARAGWVLSFATDAAPAARAWEQCRERALQSGLVVLSGPEGGLAPAEEAMARQAGFEPVSLGRRVLRADTAPLAALAVVGALMDACP